MVLDFVIPPLVMGGIIGLIELFFVHADERGLGWLSHGLHALPVAMVLTFVAMNIGYVFALANIAIFEAWWFDLGVRVILGLVATFKVKSAAAVVQGHNSVGEKLGHAFIVGVLIAASPYIWDVVAPFLPAFLGGGAS